jgi:hypothetical protein
MVAVVRELERELEIASKFSSTCEGRAEVKG